MVTLKKNSTKGDNFFLSPEVDMCFAQKNGFEYIILIQGDVSPVLSSEPIIIDGVF